MAMAMLVLVVVALTIMVLLQTTESAPTTSSPPNCDSAAAPLLACYSYVTGPDVKPPSECCAGLETVNSNAVCVCELITQLNSTTTFDSSVNLTKAFNLLRDCDITLNAHNCPALADLILHPPKGVVISPALAPTSSPDPSPEAHVPATAMDIYNAASRLQRSTFVILALAVQAFL